MRKILKRTGAIILLVIVLAVFWQWNLVNYGFDQLRGQLRIIWNAEPIEKVLTDPAFPDSLKAKLILIQEIKAFATDSLGIKESANYSTVYDQKGEPVLWVLTGAESYRLKEKTWNFPFLGEVSYKGFFKKEDGIKEEKQLINEGFDTQLGVTSAWSTLGFFRDPVLSNMLQRSEGSLANLIIHELTHGTLYVKDDVEFNENLASFIGDQGAKRFLQYKYGNKSKQFKEYIENLSDDTTFNAYIVRSAKRLDSLYNTFSAVKNDQKDSLKNALIASIVAGVKEQPLHETDYYFEYTNKTARTAKNAFFMDYMRYSSKKDIFENELDHKFKGNLKAYLAYLKEKYPSI